MERFWVLERRGKMGPGKVVCRSVYGLMSGEGGVCSMTNKDRGYDDVCPFGPRDEGSGEAKSFRGKKNGVLPESHMIWKLPCGFC